MARHYWGVHTVGAMFFDARQAQVWMPDGRPAIAVAEPYPAGRLRAAWEVFRGRAFAIRWPKPGELEIATGQWERGL